MLDYSNVLYVFVYRSYQPAPSQDSVEFDEVMGELANLEGFYIFKLNL